VEALTPHANQVVIGTFHSTCARWLREFASELGFTSDFTIFDEKDSLSAIKNVLKQLGVRSDESGSANDYKSAIARAKTYGWFPADAQSMAQAYPSFFPSMGVEAYRLYQEYLASCNAMDFSDLLMNMLLLLKNNLAVRGVLQRRFKHVLVDEYQDTNQTQFEIISYLVDQERNLFVVGDDDQSIYSWRGANPQNILNFEEHYPGATRICLEQNYRCTGNIVKAASAMICHNEIRADKVLWTENQPGDPIEFFRKEDGEIEAWAVVDLIMRESRQFDLKDIAVFYRTNAQSRQMEDALRRENIPYRIYGSLRFYDRAEIKDLLAYLRLCLNPGDDIAFLRVVNVPGRGIGKAAQDQLSDLARQRGKGLFVTAVELVEESYPRLGSKLAGFVRLMQKMKKQVLTSDLDQVISWVLMLTDYSLYVQQKFPDQAQDKIANIHELGAALADYAGKNPGSSLARWMQDVSLSGSEEQSEGGVSLMTLHSAKGLEFRRVYLIGVEDGLLPHSNSMKEKLDLEEERRLFYVGMTRAREKLTLLAAEKRRVYTTWNANSPSRFLREIPADILSFSSSRQTYQTQQTPDDGDLSYHYETEEKGELYIGAPVYHPTYGKGIVEDISDEFGVAKATVDFMDHGQRRIKVSHLVD
jgi:DNA helicase-2/ATP-dependent DNA helicase PcrA